MANHLSADRIREIHHIVFELVAEHGYDAVRIDQIAKAAHVSTATIYRNWGSKSALVISVFTADEGRERDNVVDTGSLLGDLHALIDVRADLLELGLRFLVSITLAMRRDEELAAAYRERALPAIVGANEAIVQRAIARGELDADSPIVSRITSLSITPWVVSGLLLGEPMSADCAHEFIDVVIAPLVSSAASPSRS